MALLGRSFPTNLQLRLQLGLALEGTVSTVPLTADLAADALGSYVDQFDADLDLNANLTADALGSYADQRACTLALNVAPPADDLESYNDTLNAQIRHSVAQTDNLNAWLDSPAATLLGALAVAPAADSLNSWLDSLIGSLSLQVAPSADAMTAADSLSGFVAYRAQLAADDAEQYVDQSSVQTTGLLPLTAAPPADSLNNWIDAAAGRVGLSVAPPADDAEQYAETVAGFETYRATPPADSMAPSDQVSVQTTATLPLTAAPAADSLNSWADSPAAFETYRTTPPADAMAAADSIAGFIPYAAQVTDSLNFWGDQASVQTTAVSPLSASFTDPANNWADSAAGREGLFAAASDGLGQYADTTAGLQSLLAKPSTDALGPYLDSIDGGKATALTVAFTDPLSIYADTLARSQDRLAGLTDPLPVYADQLSARLGLMISAIEPLSTPVDSAVVVLALRYALTDSALAIADLVDSRVGLFNEVRVALSDNLNQWLDAAAYTRQYFALKVSGELDDDLSLTGEVIEAQIALSGAAINQPFALTGRVSDGITLTGKVINTGGLSGELDIGET